MRPPRSPRAALRELQRLRLAFGPNAAARKRRLIHALERARLDSVTAVLAFHEALCFARAYPDDRATLRAVERALVRFARRADLRRHRAALADSGIAGAAIHYRFFAETTKWLARRWPKQLRIEWGELGDAPLLEALLPLLAAFAETPGLDELDYGLRGWIDRMKSDGETDAAFLIRSLERLVPDAFLHEKLVDVMDVPFVLESGHGTPSRTLAVAARAPLAFQRRPLATHRPDLRAEIARPPRSVRALSEREGARLIDLARAAMVTRSRDLDVFAYGDPRDVRMVDCGEGLAFVCIGAEPERRLLLESVYGYLTLKNGVPVGYVLTSTLYGSAELAYNVFETFRGAEAAPIFARMLAMTRHLFGCDTFTIVPYQLGGDGNEEGLASGAWWFYRKLGFEPRHAGARRLMHAEEARMRRRPRHRSSRATLERLAAHNVYFSAGRPRADVMGLLPLPRAGLAATRMLSRRFGADRERAEDACERVALGRLRATRMTGWSADQRMAWRRWAPLVTLLPGLERWSAGEKYALIEVVRAKGGRRESEFVRAFDAHAKLRAALAKLIHGTPE